jgi:hypothetical protein
MRSGPPIPHAPPPTTEKYDNEGDEMARYVIEREIPAIGTAERDALRDASATSNGVLAEMNAEYKTIQWEHSYVAADKTFCVYQAASEELIHEHARRAGFPATVVTRVATVIDPVTAEA